MGVNDPQVSLIIPTLNEAANLPALAERIAAAMGRRPYEILIVDDNSSDGTPEVCAELSRTYPLKLLVRPEPANGLSGAVLHGMARARGEFLVVMDADLQHPPERIGALLEPLERNEADFVIGSRYMPGGSMEKQWGFFRWLNSRVATLLARPFAGRVHDPMSGFFALRRQTYQRARRLTPLGYKIGLELMCKAGVRHVREVPIHFATRQQGESKLTLTQQFRYLEHLSRLYDYRFPRASPMVKFLIATACGWLLGLAVFALFWTTRLGPAASVILAYGGVVAVIALFHLRYVRTQREFLVRPKPWLDFWLIAAVEWLACAAAAIWIAWRIEPVRALEIALISFGLATLVRYVLRKELWQDIR